VRRDDLGDLAARRMADKHETAEADRARDRLGVIRHRREIKPPVGCRGPPKPR
jgi:hypothetical protein